jgi:hypothetical protein
MKRNLAFFAVKWRGLESCSWTPFDIQSRADREFPIIVDWTSFGLEKTFARDSFMK